MPFPVMIILFGTSWNKRHGRRVIFKIPHQGLAILEEFSSRSKLTSSAVVANLSTWTEHLGYKLEAYDNRYFFAHHEL